MGFVLSHHLISRCSLYAALSRARRTLAQIDAILGSKAAKADQRRAEEERRHVHSTSMPQRSSRSNYQDRSTITSPRLSSPIRPSPQPVTPTATRRSHGVSGVTDHVPSRTTHSAMPSPTPTTQSSVSLASSQRSTKTHKGVRVSRRSRSSKPRKPMAKLEADLDSALNQAQKLMDTFINQI